MVDDLFTKENVGPLIKVGAAAERLAEPGLSVEHAAGQLRGLASRGLVYASGQIGTGRTAHKLYSLPDLGVAKILSMLTVDLGVSKPPILQWVQSQLYGWGDHYTKTDSRYRGPIQAAMAGVARGEFWVCRIDICRSDQSGSEIIRTYVYDSEKGPPKSSDVGEYLPRQSITMPLWPIFTRLLADRSGAN